MAASGLARLPIKAVDGLLDRVFSVVGALTLAQAPAFISHYIQRLAGHLAEAERSVVNWLTIAHKAGLADVVQLAARYRSSANTEVIEAGNKCLADLQRVEELRAALTAIREAPVWRRGVELIVNMDRSIAAGTLKDFQPNLPMTLESAIYALLGIVAGLIVYAIFKAVLKMIGRALASASHHGSGGTPEKSGK